MKPCAETNTDSRTAPPRNEPVRALMVISSLSSGGAERVMSIMANHWAGRRWDVRIATFDDGSVPPFYDLSASVQHVPLGVAGHSANLLEGLRANLRRVTTLRRMMREFRPDVVISFVDRTNIVAVIAAEGLGIPLIVSERLDPSVQRHRGFDAAWTRLRNWAYRRASRVVVQTRNVHDYYAPDLGNRLRIIANPITDVRQAPDGADLRVPRPAVLTLGRLVREKNHDLLIRAFARISPQFPDWSLVIVGEGPLRGHLEKLAASLGVADRVSLPGRSRQPIGALRQADIFVLSSRTEGFPNALCEAMACRLPVISCNCRSGPSEIIRDGDNGILVPVDDEVALADAMAALMRDPDRRAELAGRATDVVDRFAAARIMDRWEEVVCESIGRTVS